MRNEAKPERRMDISGLSRTPIPHGNKQDPADAALHSVARELEASFLNEMLKHAGLGAARDSFGGGIGEEQFSGFMTRIQAEKLADAGGIGLAQHIFESLKERQNGE
ncbi:MAG: flagellar protein FlgJ [Paracoccaceae bacterium]|jgi:Rod binding domain-containing protein|tara:strand:- start:309 stop:629 length:321 start_codon:yes stop_codon:yes gene_type:complete